MMQLARLRLAADHPQTLDARDLMVGVPNNEVRPSAMLRTLGAWAITGAAVATVVLFALDWRSPFACFVAPMLGVLIGAVFGLVAGWLVLMVKCGRDARGSR